MDWLLLLLMPALLFLSFQDFSRREISWWLLPLILLSLLANQMRDLELTSWMMDSLLNLGFLLTNLLLVSLYFALKEKKWVNIVDRQLGLGDILFLALCVFAFDFVTYLIFNLLSLVLALLMALFFILSGKKEQSIPLAGIMAMLLFVVLVANVVLDKNLLRGEILLQNNLLKL